MKIHHELRYAASPDEVYEMRADPAFRERVCEEMDTAAHEVAVDEGADLSVRIDMVQHTEGVPGFAKKIIGDRTRVVQNERWATREAGDLEVEVPGKPAHIRGRLTITPAGEETVYAFDGEAKMNVPLIGGKLEGLIQKLFVAGMDAEGRVGRAWLAGELA
jgi:hypothetical protein